MGSQLTINQEDPVQEMIDLKNLNTVQKYNRFHRSVCWKDLGNQWSRCTNTEMKFNSYLVLGNCHQRQLNIYFGCASEVVILKTLSWHNMTEHMIPSSPCLHSEYLLHWSSSLNMLKDEVPYSDCRFHKRQLQIHKTLIGWSNSSNIVTKSHQDNLDYFEGDWLPSSCWNIHCQTIFWTQLFYDSFFWMESNKVGSHPTKINHPYLKQIVRESVIARDEAS